MEDRCTTCLCQRSPPDAPHIEGLLRRRRARSGRLGRCVVAVVEVPALRSSFAGFRFPPDVITIAVSWYLDQFGQVIDVLVTEKRDLEATRRFFTQALQHGPSPTEVTTARPPTRGAR